ncbi:MAG: peptide chain release factor 1 [Chloroflexi bacterium]|nr:MAG: peptide chain release factor 1 [Chloroflexota bacterium]
MMTLTPTERDALLNHFEEMAHEAPFNLLTRRQLEDLAGIESTDAPIVSLYLDLSPEYRIKRAWATALKSLARETLRRIEDRETEQQVAAEIERIERALAQRIPALGRGVALFVSEPLGIWRQIALPVALPNRLEVGRRPFLRPLLRTLDEHDRFVVVLLDKRRARLFVSQIGYTQEVAGLFEETPSHHEQGGWSQMRFQRHHDAHVLWHAGAVAHATVLTMEQFGAHHLLVSGTPEILAEYREHLPPAFAERLDGTFNLPIEATVAEVAEAIEPLQHEVEAREEVATIERLRELAPAGRGVWGPEPTLQMLTEQRVMTLIVHQSYQIAGGECTNCGLLTTHTEEPCPACNSHIQAMDDIVELALERAVAQDATLEIVCSEPATALLENSAPIGALLRY